MKISIISILAIILFNSILTLNAQEFQMPVKPEHYICYRTSGPLTIDGKMDEKDWQNVPWTKDFIDIEGDKKPAPRFRTQAKMLWDENFLYVAAYMEEPHLWGKLTERESVIFYDPDFEVFIDPDGDTHHYVEFEMNALNTQWDLLITKPYRDDTINNVALDNWDFNGIKSAVYLLGTLNNPCDIDTGWYVEIAIPLDALAELSVGGKRPVDGQQYRLNFSRVEWHTEIINGRYEKSTHIVNGKTRSLPEDNWVWSPQGVINMHRPETWGYLHFSDKKEGEGLSEYILDKDAIVKWALRELYYKQREYKTKFNTYTSNIKLLGLDKYKVNGLPFKPIIHATTTSYEATLKSANGSSTWHIEHQGRLWKE